MHVRSIPTMAVSSSVKALRWPLDETLRLLESEEGSARTAVDAGAGPGVDARQGRRGRLRPAGLRRSGQGRARERNGDGRARDTAEASDQAQGVRRAHGAVAAGDRRRTRAARGEVGNQAIGDAGEREVEVLLDTGQLSGDAGRRLRKLVLDELPGDDAELGADAEDGLQPRRAAAPAAVAAGSRTARRRPEPEAEPEAEEASHVTQADTTPQQREPTIEVTMDRLEGLERLADLRDRDILTDEEFDAAKSSILHQG